MYTERKLPIKVIYRFSYQTILIFTIWSSIVVAIYKYLDCPFLAIPFLPIATIGTALAFYLGMKNTSAYDRLYEGRKNWGGIVNDSRAWTAMLNAYISPLNKTEIDEKEVNNIKMDLAKRHIAWLYAHKFYLRNKLQPWEHNHKINNEYRKRFQDEFNISTELKKDLKRYLNDAESSHVSTLASPATQILNNQSLVLRELRAKNIIEDFRLFEMQNHINKLLEHQGKNERLKNFPFPRQFSWMANLVIGLFCMLLPFGLLNEMNKQGETFLWLTIPFSALISWVFIFMNQNADYSETPFTGLSYDVPITSMTRNIEIDMMQMLGEKETLNPILPKGGILM